MTMFFRARNTATILALWIDPAALKTLTHGTRETPLAALAAALQALGTVHAAQLTQTAALSTLNADSAALTTSPPHRATLKELWTDPAALASRPVALMALTADPADLDTHAVALMAVSQR